MSTFQVNLHSSRVQLLACFVRDVYNWSLGEALTPVLFQAEEWQRGKKGNAQTDLDLLQRISNSDPEAFWPPVLDHLRIQFHRKPSRLPYTLQNTCHVTSCHGTRVNRGSAFDT